MSIENNISIREANIEDLEILCKIRNNEELFRGYLDECQAGKAYFLVAEIEEKIVGFGLVYLDVTKTGKKKSHLPKLSDLYVAKSYRKKGVATALVKFRESLARQSGHSQIYVSIDPDESPEMINLAKKLNYLPLQTDPYPVTATFYDYQGQAYEKTYFRIDFRKSLL
ncbi:MAG: GNAT family N-acetyltransferase [Blastocatellia bacterium]